MSEKNGSNHDSGTKRLGRFTVQEELALLLSGKASRAELGAGHAFRAGLLNHLLFKAQIENGRKWLEEEKGQSGTDYGWIDATREQLAAETLKQRDTRSIGMYLDELVKAKYLTRRKPERVNHHRIALRKLCQDLLDRGMEMDDRQIEGERYSFQRLCQEFELKRRTVLERLIDALARLGVDPPKIEKVIPPFVGRIEGMISAEETEQFLDWIIQQIRGLTSRADLEAFVKSVVDDPESGVAKWRMQK